MTGDELRAAGIRLFGERGWQSALAGELGIDRTQIWRYVTGGRVPGPVGAAINAWLRHGPPASWDDDMPPSSIVSPSGRDVGLARPADPQDEDR